jgi:hypothetical protein
MLSSSKKRRFLSVHDEDDSDNQNGSVEQKKRKEKPSERESLRRWLLALRAHRPASWILLFSDWIGAGIGTPKPFATFYTLFKCAERIFWR